LTTFDPIPLLRENMCYEITNRKEHVLISLFENYIENIAYENRPITILTKTLYIVYQGIVKGVMKDLMCYKGVC